MTKTGFYGHFQVTKKDQASNDENVYVVIKNSGTWELHWLYMSVSSSSCQYSIAISPVGDVSSAVLDIVQQQTVTGATNITYPNEHDLRFADTFQVVPHFVNGELRIYLQGFDKTNNIIVYLNAVLHTYENLVCSVRDASDTVDNFTVLNTVQRMTGVID